MKMKTHFNHKFHTLKVHAFCAISCLQATSNHLTYPIRTHSTFPSSNSDMLQKICVIVNCPEFSDVTGIMSSVAYVGPLLRDAESSVPKSSYFEVASGVVSLLTATSGLLLHISSIIPSVHAGSPQRLAYVGDTKRCLKSKATCTRPVAELTRHCSTRQASAHVHAFTVCCSSS